MPELGKSLLGSLKEDEKSDLLEEIFRTVTFELDEFSDAWSECEDGYNYLAGNQDIPESKQWFKTQDRPQYAYNLIFPRFNQVMGDFLLTNIKRRVFPLPGGSGQTAELFQKLLDQMYEEKEIKFNLMSTALAGVIKQGFAYPCISNDRNIEGDVTIKNLNEFKVCFDSRAEHPLLDDAAYMFRLELADGVDLKNMWPEHRRELSELLDMHNNTDHYRDWVERIEARQLQKMVMHHDMYDRKEGKYTIVEYHRFVWKPVTIFTDLLTGRSEIWIDELEQRKKDFYLQLHPVHKFTERVAKVKVITTVIPALNFVAEHYEPPLQDGTFDILKFSFYPYAKKAINNFGIFKNAQSVQDAFNEDENEKRHLLRWHASAGYRYRPEHFHNPQDVELYNTRPNQNYAIKSEAPSLDEVMKRNEPAGNPEAVIKMSQDSADLVDKVTGFAANFLFGATQTSNENASLFAQRIQQTQQTLQIGYSQWAWTNQRLDNKGIRLMQMFYPAERALMIAMPRDSSMQEITAQIIRSREILQSFNSDRYESYVDEQNRTPTMRLVRFRLKSELVQMLAQLLGPNAVMVIPWDWYLRDSVDLGDVEPLIHNLQAFTQQTGAAGEEEEAIQRVYQLLEGAKQQMELQKLAGENVQRQGGEQERMGAMTNTNGNGRQAVGATNGGY